MVSTANVGTVAAQGATSYLSTNTKPVRKITDITLPDGSTLPDLAVQVWIEETHHDEVEITSHPVEFGAMITDHAFKRPAEVILKLGWSNSPTADSGLLNSLQALGVANSPLVASVSNAYNLYQGAQSLISGAAPDQINATYSQLLTMQESMCLFTLETGKRIYSNMMIKSVSTETDFKSANALFITMICQEIILVESSFFELKPQNQKNPADTASPKTTGKIDFVKASGLPAPTPTMPLLPLV